MLLVEISFLLMGTFSGGISMKWNTAGSGRIQVIPVSGGKANPCEVCILLLATHLIRSVMITYLLLFYRQAVRRVL